MDTRWYETFFSGLILEIWRKVMPPERTKAEVDFLERTLRLKPGSAVLDVPCGHGRHSIEMARRGHRVTGVDLSNEEIVEANRRAAAEGVAVEWRNTDMRELPTDRQFDAAYCFGNSFAYMEPAANRDFLAAIARVLPRGARFVMDSGAAAESRLADWREREWGQIDDVYWLEENRYHVAESCRETIHTIVRGNETISRSEFLWIYTVRELRALLAEAGLKPLEMVRSLEGEPYELGSGYLIIVAERM